MHQHTAVGSLGHLPEVSVSAICSSGKPWLEIFGANFGKKQFRRCKLCTIQVKHNEISSLSSRDLNHLHIQCIKAVYAIFQLVTGEVSLISLTVLVPQQWSENKGSHPGSSQMPRSWEMLPCRWKCNKIF